MERKHLLEETRNKISLAKMGQIPWNKGMKYSEEMKARLDLSGLNKTGFHGKHTEESKKKMSDSRKGNKAWNQGLKGRQFWHDITGLGTNIDFKKRGQSISKAMTGMKRPDNYKEKRAKLMKQKWEDPEFREMILQSRIGKYNSETQRQHGLKGLEKLHNLKGPTSIEKAIYDYLLLKGILFEKQKRIGNRFIVDAYIPSLNLVIEADGTYWHSLEGNIKRDKAKNIYLKKKGINLIRLTEQEINSGKFKERLVL